MLSIITVFSEMFVKKSEFKLYQKNMLLLWECRDISCSRKTWRGKSKQVNLWHFIDCPKALRNIGTIFSKKGEGSLRLTSYNSPHSQISIFPFKKNGITNCPTVFSDFVGNIKSEGSF